MRIPNDRQLLHDRHRLSHEQIDVLLGENRAKEFLQEKMKRMEAVRHFLYITDLLRDDGISFVCIKGPLLSYRIYGDATVRSSHDIDLLVETSSLSEIVELMCKAGFELTEGYFWPKEAFKQKLIQQGVHHLSFYSKERLFFVEIHWSLTTSLPVSQNIAELTILQNTEHIVFAGRCFTVLNRELELTYLIIHGARHGWCRLKWLIDLKDYPLENLDLAKWEQLIKKFHVKRILGQTNLLLERFFNKKLPLEGSKKLPSYLIRYMEKVMVEPINTGNSLRYFLQAYRYYWLLFPHVQYRWSLFRSMFSRPDDLIQSNLSSRMAYYLFRPLSFIKRRILHV